MAIRVLITPVTTVNGRPKSKLATLNGVEYSTLVPNVNGKNKSFCVAIARTTNWNTINADATITDVFGGALPATVDSRDALVAWMKATTVGDLPAATQTKINAGLDKLGVQHSDFNVQTPIWNVFRRVVHFLLHDDDFVKQVVR